MNTMLSFLAVVTLGASAMAQSDLPNPELAEIAFNAYAAALKTDDESRRADQFRQAQAALDTLRDRGVQNAQIERALGNIHQHLDRPGRAMAAFMRAKQLDPVDRRIDDSIESIRRDAQLPPIVNAESWVDYAVLWKGHVSRELVWALGALAWVAMAAAIATPGRTRRLGLLVGIPVAIATWGGLITEQVFTRPAAIIVEEPATAYRGPNATVYAPAFETPLPIATRVQISGRRDGWLEISLPDGRAGWIPADSAEWVTGEGN